MLSTRLVDRALVVGVALSAAWAYGAAPNAVATPIATGACPPASSAPTSTPPSGVQGSTSSPAIVACVGPESITEVTFQHWRAIAVADSSPPHHGRAKKRGPSSHELVEEVMGFLISAAWVQGEARDLHVHVSRREVRQRFTRIRREQFPHMRRFRALLRKTRQTVADLMMRVELSILAERIQRRVASGHRGPKRQREAMSKFVGHFRAKWRGRTYCAPQYAVADCGHVQAFS